jgi:hypothetical protein
MGMNVEEKTNGNKIDLLNGAWVFLEIELVFLEKSHAEFLQLSKVFRGLECEGDFHAWAAVAAGNDGQEMGVECIFCGGEVGEVEERVFVVKDLQCGIGALNFANKLIQEPWGFGLRFFWEFNLYCVFKECFPPWAEVTRLGAYYWRIYGYCYTNPVLQKIG